MIFVYERFGKKRTNISKRNGDKVLTANLKPPRAENLNLIQKDFLNYQNQAFPKREPAFFSLELAGECGELANCEKKIWRDPSKALDKNKLADEAADVFIALMNYCNSREINLEFAVENKLIEIEKRRIQGKMGALKSTI
jgi:NTP pyrophosphatase (non-canonical NTP hydrolase)